MKTKYYVDVLKCILSGTVPSEETANTLSLAELGEFALLNKLVPLTAEFLPLWETKETDARQYAGEWKLGAMQLVFGEQRKLQMTKQLLAEAEKRNLPLIFFKGYLLAELYKNFALRNSSDTDILINEADLEQTALMLKELNYRPVRELDTENVYTFIYEERGMTVHKIELHTSLYEDAVGEEAERLNRLQLTNPECIVSATCCGMKVRTLRHTEHFIYQIFHMVKHLCCHGFPARYLLDTVLFLKKYGKEIEWMKVNNAVKELGYGKFYACLLSVLTKYLELPEEGLPELTVQSEELTGTLLQDILHFGARSYGEELSDAFYYFETYIEKQEAMAGKRLEQITFDGTTVPEALVPVKHQQSEKLKKRIKLLRDMELI